MNDGRVFNEGWDVAANNNDDAVVVNDDDILCQRIEKIDIMPW